MEVQVNGTAKSFTLPAFVAKSLTPDINAASCGSIVQKVFAKDSSGATVQATFASYVQGSNLLTIRATLNEQAGEYSLELHGSLDLYPDVKKFYQLFDVVITKAEPQKLIDQE